MLEHGLKLDPDLVADGDMSVDSGLQATEQLLASQQPPTAIFASNDDIPLKQIGDSTGVVDI